MLMMSCPAGAQSNTRARAVPEVRQEASAGSLNSINPPEAASRLEELKSALRDRSSLERVRAVEEIDASNTIDAATAENLLREALDDKDPLVSEAGFRALARRGDERVRLVSESDAEEYPGPTGELAKVRFAALRQDTSDLRELMWNGDAVVQEAAFEALASSDATAAIQALRAELQDPTSLYRLQTLELFVRSPYTNSSATLTPILELASEDHDSLIQERAKQVLAEKRAESRQNHAPVIQTGTDQSMRRSRP